jgi:putative Mg2+ transporter-C (MgtC) family protein
MEILWSELTAGLHDVQDAVRVVIRLMAAMLLGAVVGIQRERVGKAAGMRTHILVTVGTALFVIGCTSVDMGLDGLSRVIQGIATGIGFIGTGTILKLSDKMEIHGLTTAAGLFMTSAVGVAVGLGRIGIAILGAVLAWIVLSLFAYIEVRADLKKSKEQPAKDGSAA